MRKKMSGSGKSQVYPKIFRGNPGKQGSACHRRRRKKSVEDILAAYESGRDKKPVILK